MKKAQADADEALRQEKEKQKTEATAPKEIELDVKHAEEATDADKSQKLKKVKKRKPRAEASFDEETGDIKWHKDVPQEAGADLTAFGDGQKSMDVAKTVDETQLASVETDLSHAKQKVVVEFEEEQLDDISEYLKVTFRKFKAIK